MYSSSLRRAYSSAISMNITNNTKTMHHLKTIYNINPSLTAHPLRVPLTIKLPLSIIRSTKTIIERINNLFYLHPVIAGSLFSGIKTELADLFAQNRIEGTSMSDIDWSRNFLFFLFGTVHCGMITYFTLVKCYPYLFPATRRYSVAARVVFDQFVTTPLIYFPSFYTCKCIVFEKHGFGFKKWKEYQNKYWNGTFKQDVMASAKIWGPAHIITFTLIPNHLKLLWIGGVSAAWTVILSILRGANDDVTDQEMDGKIVDMDRMATERLFADDDINDAEYYGDDEGKILSLTVNDGVMDLFDGESIAGSLHQFN